METTLTVRLTAFTIITITIIIITITIVLALIAHIERYNNHEPIGIKDLGDCRRFWEEESSS